MRQNRWNTFCVPLASDYAIYTVLPQGVTALSTQPDDHGTQPDLNFSMTSDYAYTHIQGVVIGGKYTLLEKLGTGGMGEVWLAQQSEPIRRRVALKLIKEGMDSKAVLARFEAERQALAVMNHPNIAKVFDAGLTEQGHPYFVMEWINGVSITRYCDAHKLTPRARLELFIPVCQAIQHAHHKGIIHRDIKPSNVLVASYDDVPIPKVIDFGVAKATGGTLTDVTLNTGFGMLVGTPEYMSPEQASMQSIDIDTRSDIYSLGVLLYELLTGSPPFRRKELEAAGLQEILRVIREEDPPKPSTKVSTADELPSLSANRSTLPSELPSLLRNELDWIVMKALAKERERRYDSANALAQDIDRHLHNEPVLASPPSTSYRLKKFFAKHRGKVMAAAAIILSLVVGIIGTAWQAIEARRAEVKVTEERDKAIAAEADTKAFGDFLVNHVLAAAQPEGTPHGLGVDVKLSQALAQAQNAIPNVFLGRTQAEARARQALGITWRILGNYHDGEQQLRRALELLTSVDGEEGLLTLSCANSLAVCLSEADRDKEAIPYFVKSLKKYQVIWPEDHPDRVLTELNLALSFAKVGREDESGKIIQRVIDIRKRQFGPDHLLTLKAIDSKAQLHVNREQFREALQLRASIIESCQRASLMDHPDGMLFQMNYAHSVMLAGKPQDAAEMLLKIRDRQKAILGENHLQCIATLQNLASAYIALGKYPLALETFNQAITLGERLMIPSHESSITTQAGKAHALRLIGRAGEAVVIYEKLRDLLIQKRGMNHRYTLTMFNDLGTAYFTDNRRMDAIKAWETARDGYVRHFGPESTSLLAINNNLAGAYMMNGQFEAAARSFENLLEIMKVKLVADHPNSFTLQHNLASCYFKLNRLEDAEKQWLDCEARMVKKFNDDHPNLLAVRDGLAMVQSMQGKHGPALELHQRNLDKSRKLLGANHMNTLKFMFHQVESCRRARQFQEGVKLHRELIAQQRTAFKNKPMQLADALEEWVLTLDQAEIHAEAITACREWLALCITIQNEGQVVKEARFQLSGFLLKAKQYEEAEKLLLLVEKQIKLAPSAPSDKVTRQACLTRLVDLYKQWNKPDEARKYQEQLH